MKIVIVGGGIGGLALALALHARGLDSEVFEAVAEVREVGVGITLLPHAMRELAALGLASRIEPLGIENLESVFCNRWGQFIFSEPRGRHAGYELPEISLHRGRLHRVLLDAVLERLGEQRVHLNHRFVRVDQGEAGATVHFVQAADPARLRAVTADIVVGCDGVNSSVRRQFYPDEPLAFAGINTWRGVTRHKPILTGKSYLRIGSIDTGKMVIYPIVDEIDDTPLQLINWVAEIRRADSTMNDWNRPGRIEDFIDIFADWRYDWLDVPALLRSAERIYEYPMVDRDPVAQWSFGRVTLLGDAAHPMYPRGSNGSAQALIDARVLAEAIVGLEAGADPRAALKSYEVQRLAPTARIVETNRSVPPDYIIMKVDELSGGQPFTRIDDVISPHELQAISDEYKRIAGFSLAEVKPK
jgi:5-methylphenazine-1-carboxylate 1-monooxygenase